MSLTIGKIDRLTDVRGVHRCPASVQVFWNSSSCSACSSWNGTPVSSLSSVELIRFMPCRAVHSAVARVPAPHQMRSRSPSECGSRRSRPGGLANIGRGLGSAKPSPDRTSRKTRVCSRAISAASLPSSGW